MWQPGRMRLDGRQSALARAVLALSLTLCLCASQQPTRATIVSFSMADGTVTEDEDCVPRPCRLYVDREDFFAASYRLRMRPFALLSDGVRSNDLQYVDTLVEVFDRAMSTRDGSGWELTVLGEPIRTIVYDVNANRDNWPDGGLNSWIFAMYTMPGYPLPVSIVTIGADDGPYDITVAVTAKGLGSSPNDPYITTSFREDTLEARPMHHRIVLDMSLTDFFPSGAITRVWQGDQNPASLSVTYRGVEESDIAEFLSLVYIAPVPESHGYEFAIAVEIVGGASPISDTATLEVVEFNDAPIVRVEVSPLVIAAEGDQVCPSFGNIQVSDPDETVSVVVSYTVSTDVTLTCNGGVCPSVTGNTVIFSQAESLTAQEGRYPGTGTWLGFTDLINSICFTTAAGFSGAAVISIQATDSLGSLSNTITRDLLYSEVVSAPVITGVTDLQIGEDTPPGTLLSFGSTVVLNDPDPADSKRASLESSNGMITLSLISTTTAVTVTNIGRTILLDAVDHVTLQNAYNNIVVSVVEDFFGEVTFTLTLFRDVTDDVGVVDAVDTFVIDVIGEDEAPKIDTLSVPTSIMVTEDVPMTLDLSTVAISDDEDDSLVVTVEILPAGAGTVSVPVYNSAIQCVAAVGATIDVTCPLGSVIADVIFAAYGAPLFACDDRTTQSIPVGSLDVSAALTAACDGLNTCSFTATGAVGSSPLVAAKVLCRVSAESTPTAETVTFAGLLEDIARSLGELRLLTALDRTADVMVQVTVTDSAMQSEDVSITVGIDAVYDPPQYGIPSIGMRLVQEGDNFELSDLMVDLYDDESSTLELSLNISPMQTPPIATFSLSTAAAALVADPMALPLVLTSTIADLETLFNGISIVWAVNSEATIGLELSLTDNVPNQSPALLTLSFEITADADPPTLSLSTASFATSELQDVTLNVGGMFEDPEDDAASSSTHPELVIEVPVSAGLLQFGGAAAAASITLVPRNDNVDGVTFTPMLFVNGDITVTYTVTDSAGASDSAVAIVSVSPVESPPDVVFDASALSAGGNLEISEDQSVPFPFSLVEDDPDDGDLTLSLTFPSADCLLAVPPAAGLSSSLAISGSDSVLTIVAPLDALNSVLGSASAGIRSTSESSFVMTLAVMDFDGNPNTFTLNVMVTPVNNPAEISSVAVSVDVQEDTTGLLSLLFSATDRDVVDFGGFAWVSVVSQGTLGKLSMEAGDTLSPDEQTLTLERPTIGAVNSAVGLITYQSCSDCTADDALSISLYDDGTTTGSPADTASVVINIIADAENPVLSLTADSGITTSEAATARILTVFSSVSLTDDSTADLTCVVSSDSGDELELVQGGMTLTSSGGSVSATGSPANLQSVLETLTIAVPMYSNGNVEIVVTCTDEDTLSDAASVSTNVAAVVTGVEISSTGAITDVTEEVVADWSSVTWTVVDFDSAAPLDLEVVVEIGTISSSSCGIDCTLSTDRKTAFARGTPTELSAVLNALRNTPDADGFGTETIVATVLGPRGTSHTVMYTIISDPENPVLTQGTTLSDVVVAEESSTAIGGQLAFSISVDDILLPVTVTLSVTDGTVSTISATSIILPGTASSSYSFTGSLAEVNDALLGIIYNAPDEPPPEVSSIPLSVLVVLGTNPNRSDSAQVMLSVLALNDAPELVAATAMLVGTEDVPIVVSDNTLTISDNDGDTLTLIIDGNLLIPSLSTVSGLTPSFPCSENQLCYRGFAADLTTAARTLTLTGVMDFNGATSLSYTVLDASGPTMVSRAVSVTPVIDPPVIGGDVSISVGEVSVPATVMVSEFSVTVSDDDSSNLDLVVAVVSLPASIQVFDGTTELTTGLSLSIAALEIPAIEARLRQIEFRSAPYASGSAVLRVTLTDDDNEEVTQTFTLQIANTDLPATLIPSSFTVSPVEEASTSLSDFGIVVNDDGGNLDAISVTVSSGLILSVRTGSPFAVSGDSLTLSASSVSVAALNAEFSLASAIIVTGDTDVSTSQTIDVMVTDSGGAFTTLVLSVNIMGDAEAPSVVFSGFNPSYDEEFTILFSTVSVLLSDDEPDELVLAVRSTSCVSFSLATLPLGVTALTSTSGVSLMVLSGLAATTNVGVGHGDSHWHYGLRGTLYTDTNCDR